MKRSIATSLLAAGLLGIASTSAWAEGCNSEHYSAQKDAPMLEEMATVTDTDQVLTSGQMSVAGVDCAATPNAAECLSSAPVTN